MFFIIIWKLNDVKKIGIVEIINKLFNGMEVRFFNLVFGSIIINMLMNVIIFFIKSIWVRLLIFLILIIIKVLRIKVKIKILSFNVLFVFKFLGNIFEINELLFVI